MLTERWATEADIPAISALMDRAIAELQKGFLDDDQIAASHAVMGLDTQLIADRTYALVEEDGRIAGCGGWSWRATLYGGDASQVAREARALDPAVDAARIRAMYTDPDFTRRGIGARVLSICEAAAAKAGFRRAELMATLSGEPLYRARGYKEIERVAAGTAGGVEVPLIRMGKALSHDAPLRRDEKA
jgi:N-acetylglutamate synthase-like GNAT family acetyltransferase